MLMIYRSALDDSVFNLVICFFTQVFSGSPADGELQRGDIVLTINNQDASRLSHQSAENFIRNAGGELVLRVKR